MMGQHHLGWARMSPLLHMLHDLDVVGLVLYVPVHMTTYRHSGLCDTDVNIITLGQGWARELHVLVRAVRTSVKP